MTDAFDRLKSALADRYEIEHELGAGGMATVYLAHDQKHDRKVAVKVLRPELAATVGVDRFLREIKIAANLKHSHILPLYDSGDAEGFLFYVMPYMEGESLRDRLNREKQLPIEDALKIAGEVADALRSAHRHNCIHRDIKPENILLEEGHAIVADFGIARAVGESEETRLTETGIAVGTPAYMSPEQAAGEREIDGRSDIYALGCVLYEMIAGQAPFTGPTVESIVRQHLASEPRALTELRPAVSAEVGAAVTKALAKVPADRLQNAEVLEETIAAALVSLATPRNGLAPTGTAAASRATKRRWMMVGGAVGVAAVIVVIAVLAVMPRGATVALDPERIVVAAFRNETGDPQLDVIGKQAANWITQGLQNVETVKATPWEMARQSSLYVQSEADAGRVRNPVRALAEETGAGVVISGAYYIDGEEIQLQVEVTNVVGESLLGSVPPVVGSREATSELIGRLQQQVMSFLAVRFDEQFSSTANLIGEPTTFEAYQAFDQGMSLYLQHDYQEAIPYFEQALELDSTFATALRFMALASNNVSDYAKVDSVVSVMASLRHRLTPYQAAWMEYLAGMADGDHERAISGIGRAAEIAPGSKAVYNYGHAAVVTNRPQAAVDAFLTLDPERGPMRGWSSYWRWLCHALHMLGEHERELEQARRGYQLYPERGANILRLQAIALAALGRVEELNGVLDQIVVAPDVSNVRSAMVQVAEILNAKGHVGDAQGVIARTIDWLDSRPSDELSDPDHRQWYGRALLLAGRTVEAQEVFDALVDDRPESKGYRGFRGFIAASRGDSALAKRDMDWLEQLDPPYRSGGPIYWRGAITGALGDRDEAVSLLREAFSRGYYYWWYMASDPELEPLRDHPDFQELLRPKG